MAAISKCPNCQEPVSIPLGVEAAASVRCPLCGAEYSLGVAMAMAPPELIPLPSAVAESVGATEPAGVTSDSAAGVQVDEAAAVAMQFAAVPLSSQLRSRAPKSAWRTLFEVVSGGLAGCLVAYYALAVWFGPQFPNVMPRLPLPLIERLTAPTKSDDAKESPAPPTKKPSRIKTTTDIKSTDAKQPPEGANKPGNALPGQSERGLLRPASSAKIIASVHS